MTICKSQISLQIKVMTSLQISNQSANQGGDTCDDYLQMMTICKSQTSLQIKVMTL